MRRLILLLLVTFPLAAQSKTYNGNIYATSFLGACQHGYFLGGAGGGAEGLIWKGVSVGAEASYQSFSDGWGFGLFTIQPGVHFKGKNRAARWDPFVTYGLGIVTSNQGGFGGTGNVGAGANYWFRDKLAVRFSGRVQAFANEAMFVFSLGISFR